MFGKKPTPAPTPDAAPVDPAAMAVDTLASALRSMAEFALPQERTDVDTFRRDAEAWAQHVAIAAPPPGRPAEAAPAAGRRDWQAVRQFVRDYLRGSARQVGTVTSDLREVIWVFIRNLSQTLANDVAAEDRVREQMERLATLVDATGTSELKREVAEVVGSLRQVLDERRRAQQAQVAALGETVRTLGGELETARREGETDPLTKVHNRKAFDERLEQAVQLQKAFGGDACLLLVDVDHFKQANDTAGHAVGDQVLRGVADAIVQVFLRKKDFVARYGGDEFAVLLRETEMASALALAERVAGRVRALPIAGAEGPLRVTVSIGVAAAAPGDEARTWFERADRGLYAAKAAGRDRVAAGT
ncbi:MAG: GGDEF domain-containing protein [Deltaproteobacteria bacterium]|nr:GGDEF domain-containing protein [Deltaproteobacteria bacterium]